MGGSLRVEELMRKRVETIHEDGSAEEALKRMHSRKLRHLVVVREGEVVGIVSDRDLAALLVGNFRLDRTIDQVMSRGVAVVKPGDSIEKAARLMRQRKIAALPVVDGRKLVGILTATDLLELLSRGARARRKPRQARTTRLKRRQR
jgi:acetoin utilization protein AcuB